MLKLAGRVSGSVFLIGPNGLGWFINKRVARVLISDFIFSRLVLRFIFLSSVSPLPSPLSDAPLSNFSPFSLLLRVCMRSLFV